MTAYYYGAMTPSIAYGVGVDPWAPIPGREWFPPIVPLPGPISEPEKMAPIDEGCPSIATSPLPRIIADMQRLSKSDQQRVLRALQALFGDETK